MIFLSFFLQSFSLNTKRVQVGVFVLSQSRLHILCGLTRGNCDLAGLTAVFRDGRQMALVEGAQVLDVLSKGEGVVAACGHLIAKLDPLTGHPVQPNMVR